MPVQVCLELVQPMVWHRGGPGDCQRPYLCVNVDLKGGPSIRGRFCLSQTLKTDLSKKDFNLFSSLGPFSGTSEQGNFFPWTMRHPQCDGPLGPLWWPPSLLSGQRMTSPLQKGHRLSPLVPPQTPLGLKQNLPRCPLSWQLKHTRRKAESVLRHQLLLNEFLVKF